MTLQQAKDVLHKIQNGTATEEERQMAKQAFEVVKKSIFAV